MTITEDFSPPIDFCVQALVRDGLRVDRLDRHPDGDHHLRDVGLDVDGWRARLGAGRVLNSQDLTTSEISLPAPKRSREWLKVELLVPTMPSGR
ncbi:MAG: hypothetical protein ACRDGL_05465 [Candidatus Limnocylindrales bacterium]